MGDAVLATFLALFASAVIGSIALGVTNTDSSTDIPLWAAGLLEIPLWIGLLGVPLWASRRKGSGSLVRDFGLRMRWTDPLIGLGFGVAAQIGFVVLMPPLYRLVGVDADKIGETADKLGNRATTPFSALCLFIIVVLCAPVIEEIAYRGLWLRAAERKWGTVAAVIVSGAVFGITHFQPYDTPILIAFGLVLGFLAVRYRRLGPSIWAHMWFNLAAFVALVVR
jgi:membrane protease YdiL (CAAX protease family)